jgi:hypothetical protein
LFVTVCSAPISADRFVGIVLVSGEQTFTATFAFPNEGIEQIAGKNDGACANPKQIRTDVDCRPARPKFDKGAWSPAKISDVTSGGLDLFVTPDKSRPGNAASKLWRMATIVFGVEQVGQTLPTKHGQLSITRHGPLRFCPNVISVAHPNARKRDRLTDTEVKCEACDGTGVQVVEQPKEPGKRVFPARCKVCGGKGRVPKSA